MFDTLAKNTLVPLVLRLGLAVIFIYHGMGKVNADTNWGSAWMKPQPAADGSGPSQESMPALLQILVAWGELLGGIALGLGFLTRAAAIGIAAIMIGAIYTVHGKNGFSLAKGGYEYNFAILVMCVGVILLGGGTLAVDRFLRVRPRNPAA